MLKKWPKAVNMNTERKRFPVSFFVTLFTLFTVTAFAGDLPEIKQRGVLRHLGVPYAGFITDRGDGFSKDLIRGFAGYLGVEYEFVKTSWANVIPDLIGKEICHTCDDTEIRGDAPVKGDLIANGLTVLPWRKKLIDYSTPTFPTQIWALARSDNLTLQPIQPTGDTAADIKIVKSMLKGKTVSGVNNTCLDPHLYGLSEAGINVALFDIAFDDLSLTVMGGEVDACVYDVPDALDSLRKWPGKLKIIGPLSEKQTMACGFRKDNPKLRGAFNQYLEQIKRDGTHLKLVEKYYPEILLFFPEVFEQNNVSIKKTPSM